MSALVWWLIPLLSTVVAVFWTAALARRERTRSNEDWRAARLVELGGVRSVLAGQEPTPPHGGAVNAGAGGSETIDPEHGVDGNGPVAGPA